MTVKFFLTGATGYIGGSVLAHFLMHPKRDSFEFTALVRSEEKAKKLLDQFKVKIAIGTLEDAGKLQEQASEADVVLSLANADDLKSLQSILKGQKMRHERTGVRPILIHTSGIGVVADNAHGMYAADEIYSDLDVEKFEKLPATQVHRAVELAVLEGDKEGYVDTYIVDATTVWGIADHELVKAGISNPHSIQVPTVIKESLHRKRAGMVGEGKNIWHNVYFDDLASLYVTLYDAIALKNKRATHGREGIYIAENGAYTMYQLAKAIQEAFVKLGISTETEPVRFADGALGKIDYFGVNCRCKSERSRSIGWNPNKTTKDFLASIQTEVEVFAKKQSGVTPLK